MVKTEGQRLLLKYLEDTEQTKTQLAKKLGKKKATVGDWALGRYLPDAEGVGLLYTYVGIPAPAWGEKPRRKAA